MRATNYLVSVFVGGKCASLFYSEDLCELPVCRLLFPGCEIEVHDLRKFRTLPFTEQVEREYEAKPPAGVRSKKLMKQVVCRETKEIYPSLSACAAANDIPMSDLANSIAHLSAIKGRHYLMSGDIISSDIRPDREYEKN